jgi:hypothetical protein
MLAYIIPMSDASMISAKNNCIKFIVVGTMWLYLATDGKRVHNNAHIKISPCPNHSSLLLNFFLTYRFPKKYIPANNQTPNTVVVMDILISLIFQIIIPPNIRTIFKNRIASCNSYVLKSCTINNVKNRFVIIQKIISHISTIPN